MKSKTYFLLLICLFVLSCKQKLSSPEASVEEEFIVYDVDIEQCLSEQQTLPLSSISDTIMYFELKTPYELIITNIRKVLFLKIISSSILCFGIIQGFISLI